MEFKIVMYDDVKDCYIRDNDLNEEERIDYLYGWEKGVEQAQIDGPGEDSYTAFSRLLSGNECSETFEDGFFMGYESEQPDREPNL